MESKENFGLYQSQVQTYVSFTSFMTGVVVFFAGLLLSSFHTFDISIKVPISFLIISIFGFLYSTLIYSGAAEEAAQMRLEGFRRALYLGDVISEYLGVYLLIISIPLVVTVITGDVFLRGVTIGAALVGLVMYQSSRVSMVERHFRGGYRFVSFLILFFGLVMFLTQIYRFHFAPVALVFILFMLAITYRAARAKRIS